MPFWIYLAMVLSLVLLPGLAVQTQAAPSDLPPPIIYSATFTPIPQPTATALPTRESCIDRAEFVADVTIPDRTEAHIGAALRKVWRVRNVGNCAWDYYGLAFALGDQMSGPAYSDFPADVAPGDEVEIVAVLVAPKEPGHYRGAWLLITSRQTPNEGLPLWVDIIAAVDTQNDCYEQLSQFSIGNRWASIVAGEALNSGAEGMRLVAWTMRAQVVYWGRDPEKFGPGYGWYGCRANKREVARPYVDEVLDQDPRSAPYDFMQAGGMCSHLGSLDDQMLWMARGYYDHPADYVVGYGNNSVLCFFAGFRKIP